MYRRPNKTATTEQLRYPGRRYGRATSASVMTCVRFGATCSKLRHKPLNWLDAARASRGRGHLGKRFLPLQLRSVSRWFSLASAELPARQK